MMFRIDYWALGIAALALIGFLIFWKKRIGEVPPHFLYSRIKNFSEALSGRRAGYQTVERGLYLLSLLFLLGAFLDPRLMSSTGAAKSVYTEGIAIYLVLDVSGSMGGQVVDVRKEKKETLQTKLGLLKDVTKEFIEKRPQDLIGLVSFARAAWVLSPLTLNHKMILQKLENLQVIQGREYNGSAIGYAIYKTASLIEATKQFGSKEGGYDIKGAAMILVTDGFQSPNPADKGKRLRTMGIEEAADYAKQQNARLYIVNIDPDIENPKYAPERRLMESAALETGGKFFAADDSQKLEGIYSSINQLEKSKVPIISAGSSARSYSFYPLFISLGVAALAGAIIMETLILRKVP